MKDEKGTATGLGETLRRTLRAPIPPGRRLYLALGWVVLGLFAVQVVTGILLSVYYEPTPEGAAESVRVVMRDVGYGWLVRGVHHWATPAILLAGILPLARSFLVGAYRREGSGGWHLASLFLLLLFAFAFTGSLLPWDAAAYDAGQRVLGAARSVPVVGAGLASYMSGGPEVAGQSLQRIHATHVLVLPWLSFLVVGAYLWMLLQRREGAGGER